MTAISLHDTAEAFDELFGVAFNYRKNEGRNYDFTDGVLVNQENTVALIVEEHDLPAKFESMLDDCKETPTGVAVGTPSGDAVTVKFKNGHRHIYQRDYIDKLVRFYEVDSADEAVEYLRSCSREGLYSLLFKGENVSIMIAPMRL